MGAEAAVSYVLSELRRLRGQSSRTPLHNLNDVSIRVHAAGATSGGRTHHASDAVTSDHLARASGRTDPEAAGAEMVAALLAAAPDPSQPSLLGIDDADPVEVLARKARLSLPRSNPPGRDLARLADAAKRWHWGRYKRAKSARVDRATWQPSQGFALGELAAISLGADRFEIPPGHLLCATEEGGAADLFVVPPLPLGSLAPRPLRAIEYLADKAGDGPSWYVHDFDPAYPVAQTKGGALAIVRRGSRFSIDPERGIVG